MIHSIDDHPLTDERWQAIIQNNAAYDQQFFYGVRTTGIFCRPSCRSRAPRKEHVRIFTDAGQALAESFRPCKRCRPTGDRLPDQEWVDQMIQYIDQNYRETITLDTLADICHGSPYHLQRTFKRITGVTPVEYIQTKRINEAIDILINTNKSVTEIASLVGFSNTPYFITLFKKMMEQTPNEYRRSHVSSAKTEH
ncbi:bifunctional transcriptional activator/DNA repair enzyme AdaA [Paenibacillus sp. P96]|uniref:Bifunctional transcriptional activator/DNA repair enzyme AdaA n=1 Tax=Paenibacillus zeirhizosphaerae TaxID=2987519 RepID=A0ABT9FQV2_9BACL|nr:bifunctional transcriptional activator/DNA repair enzyme AdaA [Paenibacillus sp. P96]MDP4097117.1 bifunctional transcriptional activator/DNA repair enzyme AdaA [Paenibacillus sp. P96]